MTIKLPPRAVCTKLLENLTNNCEGISATMLALRDGRPYVERAAATIEPGKFAAMSSSLLALGGTVLRELRAGNLDHICVEGASGKLVLTSVPGLQGVLILSVLAQSDCRLGQILGQAKSTARQLSELVPA